MSLINVTNIKVGNNVCSIKTPLVFQIEFECLDNLKHDVEWKIIYITSDGSGYLEDPPASSSSSDQGKSEENKSSDDNAEANAVKKEETGNEEDYLKSQNEGEIVLDAVCLGPVHKGILEFEFRVNPPNFHKMNPDSVLGMQAILITASYCDQEFIRIGYYTNNTYDDETLRESPPDVPNLDKMVRCIIDQPRVTRFPIKWDSDDLVDFEGNKLNFFSDPEKIDTEDESTYLTESDVLEDENDDSQNLDSKSPHDGLDESKSHSESCSAEDYSNNEGSSEAEDNDAATGTDELNDYEASGDDGERVKRRRV